MNFKIDNNRFKAKNNGLNLYDSNKKISPKISFGRAPKEEEKPELRKTCHEALDVLGIKNMAMIIHSSSFPSKEKDQHIGSIISTGAEKLISFLDLYGFNNIQDGPPGIITPSNISPYKGTVFSDNPLKIEYKALASKRFGNILSEETLSKVTNACNDDSTEDKVFSDFNKAFVLKEIALKEAYKNFKEKLENKDPVIEKLANKFNEFKNNNTKLEKESIYEALVENYGHRDFESWDQTDRNLMYNLKSDDDKLAINAKNRVKLLKKAYTNKIESFKFEQFIINELKIDNKKFRKSVNKELGNSTEFKYIADVLVGFSDRDLWANQEAFLSDWRLGCPYGGADNGPQIWNIPVLNPKKLFKEDGSLGVAGKLLEEKFDYLLKHYENVRVDHVLGLVDPYIYKPNSISTYRYKDENGNISEAVDRNRLNARNISELRDVDPDGSYKLILEKIVIPVMEKNGLNPKEAVWEALGTDTEVFKQKYQELKLPGITQTSWMKGQEAPDDNWSLVVSHDFEPAAQMAQNSNYINSPAWSPEYLAGYLNPDPQDTIKREEVREKIINSPVERLKLKFTALLRSTKNIQFMFTDFFGINHTYNRGGKVHEDNWKLRLNNNFEDMYYKKLEDEKIDGFAMNVPELLAKAVKAKDSMLVATFRANKNVVNKSDSDQVNEFREKLYNSHKDLLNRLNKFANILKEPSTK